MMIGEDLPFVRNEKPCVRPVPPSAANRLDPKPEMPHFRYALTKIDHVFGKFIWWGPSDC
jgi:hypothetical protein